MQTFFTNYLDILQDCHNGILQALEGLPPAALDWVPGQDMNSISVLLAHITGSERYWIGDIAAQEPSNRDRDAEFRVRGVDVDVFRKRLSDNLEYARNVLEKMSLQELESVRVSPSNGREFTVAWALIHALEHASLHLGQIQITRQLWEQSNSNA
ncbi:MAG: DinB family protein [Anaerolineae bacterium]|nr:DinB family protein [Anaerolineae bacterium]